MLKVLQKSWRRIPRMIRKPLVLMVGSSVLLAGVAMLVLPGPGWGGIFLGLTILATEFAFAAKVRNWMLARFKKAFVKILPRRRPTQEDA